MRAVGFAEFAGVPDDEAAVVVSRHELGSVSGPADRLQRLVTHVSLCAGQTGRRRCYIVYRPSPETRYTRKSVAGADGAQTLLYRVHW